MRPRPEDRGDLHLARQTAGHVVLQCGHGPKTVETAIAVSSRVWSRQPSMRPRPADRGEARSPPIPGRSRPGLQCGHGPKTVETATVAYHDAVATLLQCGHGPKTVETGSARVGVGSGAGPSMRPRPEDRGDDGQT